MTSRCQSLLAGALVLFYGSVVTVGDGWHALMPYGHCSCCCQPVEPVCAEDCCFCERRASALLALDTTRPFETKVNERGCQEKSDCPVCAFLAQVQSPSEVLDPPSRCDAVTPFRPIVALLFAPQPVHEPYSARGPPTPCS